MLPCYSRVSSVHEFAHACMLSAAGFIHLWVIMSIAYQQVLSIVLPAAYVLTVHHNLIMAPDPHSPPPTHSQVIGWPYPAPLSCLLHVKVLRTSTSGKSRQMQQFGKRLRWVGTRHLSCLLYSLKWCVSACWIAPFSTLALIQQTVIGWHFSIIDTKLFS